MKTILVCCGSGVATSPQVSQKINDFLTDQGLDGVAKATPKPIETAKLADETEKTSNYLNADSEKKQAYKEVADNVRETVTPSGDDLSTDQVAKLIDDEAKKRAELNGDAREKAKQELEKNYDDSKAMQDSNTPTPKYSNASEEKKQAFYTALETAKNILDNSDSTEDEYKTANAELEKAKAELDGQATDESKSKFDEALKKGEEVKNNSNASQNQKEVDEATKNLKEAQAGLDNHATVKTLSKLTKNNVKLKKQTLLPQTGTETNPITALGVALLALSAGIFAKKKRDDEA